MLSSLRAGAAALAATVLLTACVTEPAPLGMPQAIGVIVDVEVLERHGEEGILAYTLEDGRQVTIDQRTAAEVGPSAVAGEGRLLLVGESEGRPWWLALVKMNPGGPTMPPDCYGLDAHATDRGDAIRFDFGLDLPKAGDFDPGPGQDDGQYDDPGGGGGVARFCINSRGEVTAYGA